MGGAMPSSDKVLVSSVVKAATRELPNKGAGIVNMSQGTSALPKDKGPTPTTDFGKVVVTKRQHSDTPSSPGYHNVYVRRKVESEHNKVNSSQELKGNGRDKTKEQEPPLQGVQHDEVSKPQQDEVNKPHSDEVKKAHDDEVSKPHNEEVSKPQHEEVSKPQHKEVSKPQHEEVSKLQHEEVSKFQHGELSKPQHEEVSKPQHEEVSRLQHEEVSRLQHEEVSRLQHEEVSRPQHEEVSKFQHEEVSKPQHEEVSKPHHEDVSNLEVSKPKVASPIAKSVEVELVPSSSEKPNVETVPETTDPQAASGTGIEDDAEQSSIQYWSERFNRLQTYLENCDRSTQEGYLRSKKSVETCLIYRPFSPS
jgi:hypothetical protein